MPIILVNFSEDIKNFLNFKFLSVGIKVIFIDDNKLLRKYIESQEAKKQKEISYIIVVYLSVMSNSLEEYLVELRRNFKKKFFKFIIVTDAKLNPNFIQTMLFLDVIRIIQNNVEYSKIYDQIYSSLENLEEMENREYTRIHPLESDKVTCIIPVPVSIKNHIDPILTNVVNISVGGIGVAFQNIREFSYFEKGQIIERCQMYLDSKNLIISLEILVTIKENLLIGARFVNPNYFFLMTLSQYLLKQISSSEI